MPRSAPPQATYDPVTGALTLRGGDASDTLRLAVADGALRLTAADDLTRLVNPLPAIGLAELRAVIVEGPVELTVGALPGLKSLSLQSNGPVVLTAPLILDGALHVEAARLAVATPVHAASLDLVTTGVLDLTAGARLSSKGPVALRADALIITGHLGAARVAAQARAVVQSGTIVAPDIAIRFTESYQATASARLDAGGDVGGQILLDGGPVGNVFTSGTVVAIGATGAGGQVDVLGRSLVLVSATVDTSGASGGGRIRVGGDLQGRNPVVRNAAAVTLSSGTTLRADAQVRGTGGRVIIWADGLTEAAGNVSAQGGSLAGDGGFVELSGKAELRSAIVPNVSAPAGQAGAVLLDPKNLTIAASGSLPQFELHNPTPGAGDNFGGKVVPLSGGGIVVVDDGDDAVAKDAGAVYLFDGLSGALLSTLTGLKASDQIGSGGVTALSNGNFVISSPRWDNGAAVDAGAVTWANGDSGVTGSIAPHNSLVGTTTNDQVGRDGVTALPTANYIVRSSLWDNGTAVDAGAITWGSGVSGVVGPVSAANSLVGSSANDVAGASVIIILKNGNYVVGTGGWDNGALVNAGAMTWGSGTSGVVGPISAANSLVGTSAGDVVGGSVAIALANGNYVVQSPWWDNGGKIEVGAITWGSGTTGITGTISADNSLIGSSNYDTVGDRGVTPLSNGNYVVLSSYWSNGPVARVGAVSWGSGTGGTVGPVSAANSLVGSTANDRVGNNPVVLLTNGNYVVVSATWDNGTVVDAGAVTWGSGTGGTVGTISAANSLVGSSTSDYVGKVFALSNGNYIVRSWAWDNGTVVDAGAVTWGSGTGGTVGPVSAANSLVGSSTRDQVGDYHAIALSNGNYVVSSPYWDNGAIVDAGAVTWGSGTGGTVGVLSAANSLIGSSTRDQVGSGYLIGLSNGNYVASSPWWNNDAVVDAGAATWGSGMGGVVGVVSAENSLVGVTANDKVSNGWPAPVGDGNYLVPSPNWDNGAMVDAGAVTWGDGTSGVVGPITTANSLVGFSTGDYIANRGVVRLGDGNYLISSPDWDNGVAVNAGAVTWGSGNRPTLGPVTAANSVVGTTAGDRVGEQDVVSMQDGYLIPSAGWDRGATVDAGAVTWGNLAGLPVGPISAANSIINTGAGAGLYEDVYNSTFLMRSTADGGHIVVGFPNAAQLTYNRAAAESLTVTPELLAQALAAGMALTLQASNDLTLSGPLTVASSAGHGGALTLSAGRSVRLDADLITDGAPLTLAANDAPGGGVVGAQRDPGEAVVRMAAGTRIDAGTAAVLVDLRSGTGTTYSGPGAAELTDITGKLTVQGAPLAPANTAVGATTVTGSLSLNGGLSLTVHGNVSGQHDQVSVTGPVTLGGPLTISAIGYTPAAGDIVLLIANDGSDAVHGTFAGLPEDAAVTLGDVAMTLSYAGGDGNDVTLVAPSNAPPSFTSGSPPTGTYGASFSHTFAASGVPAPTYSADPGTLPPGLNLNPSTGVLSGKPTRAGTYSGITIIASNGVGQPAVQTVTIVVAKAPLTITAVDASKTYGALVPALPFTVAGLVNGDTEVSALTGTPATAASEASDVGDYAITQGTLDAANYAIGFVNGMLTVSKAPLTVTARDVVRRVGQANPPLTLVYTGFVLGQSATVLDTSPVASTIASIASPPGSYAITVTGGSAANYTIIRVNGTLTVQAAGKELTAEHGSMGCPGSTFVFVARGFAPGAAVVIDVDGRVVLRTTSDSTGSLRFALIFGDIAPARTYTIGATGEALGTVPALAQRVSTTVGIDPAAARLMLPPGSDFPTAKALPTVYLLLTYR